MSSRIVFGYTENDLYRYQHTACRELLIRALAKDGFSVSDRDILKDSRGKPYLDCPPHNISLSHCKGLICCMYADSPCGVDCERIRSAQKHERVIRREFSPAEQDMIYSSPDPDREFTRLWTLKEAYVKVKGTGIADIGKVSFEYGERVAVYSGMQFMTYFLDEHIISSAVLLQSYVKGNRQPFYIEE